MLLAAQSLMRALIKNKTFSLLSPDHQRALKNLINIFDITCPREKVDETPGVNWQAPPSTSINTASATVINDAL